MCHDHKIILYLGCFVVKVVLLAFSNLCFKAYLREHDLSSGGVCVMVHLIAVTISISILFSLMGALVAFFNLFKKKVKVERQVCLVFVCVLRCD